MNYCNRKQRQVSFAQCLGCEHCLPPGERRDGRLCPDELTMEEVTAAVANNYKESERALVELDRRCIEAELNGDPHRFDGCARLLDEDMEKHRVEPKNKYLTSNETTTIMADKKNLGHLEEPPMVAMVKNYGVMLTLTESEMKSGDEYVRKTLCNALAEMLCEDGYVDIEFVQADNVSPITNEKMTHVNATLYIKRKDSDILRCGKTKFVRDKQQEG